MISFVIPVYNEKESLKDFYAALEKLVKAYKDYEILFIDDGSTDSSLQILQDFEKKNPRVKIVSFRKNQGKAEALTVGFSIANGDHVVTLDADLQDKPEEVDRLLKKAKEGFDLVCGWRKNRKDSGAKIVFSRLFNLLARKFWGLKLHDYNCGLKVYSIMAAKSLSLYGGLHRFIPLLVYQEGFSVTELPVIHEKRRLGKSKYGISKVFTDLPDMFTMLFLSKFGNRPLHFFGIVGAVFFLLGSLILLDMAYIKFTVGKLGERPILFLAMLFVLAGLQIFFSGFLADLFLNVSKKSIYSSENTLASPSIKYTSANIK